MRTKNKEIKTTEDEFNLRDQRLRLTIDPIETLFNMQMRILEQQEFIIENMTIPECVDVKFISKKLCLSRTKVYSCPWLMPNFGKSDYVSGTKRWKRNTWENWNNRDEKLRRSEWLSLPQKVKEEIVNVKE